MIQTIKQKIVAIIAVAALVFVPVLAPTVVNAADAEIREGLCSGAEFQLDGNGNCNQADQGTEGVQNAVVNIVNILSIIVGVIAVIMIIFGGLRYITSGGDSSKVGTAKNTIIYAIVGLVIVAFAQFIVRFVLSAAVSIQ